jgi:DNA-binding SARP family transcriptional activator
MTSNRLRIQVCGRLAVDIDGTRREAMLPGRQGRLLFTYLVLRRHDVLRRDELVAALWPGNPPEAAETAVYALLSKCRTALGADLLTARTSVRLNLPARAWVDVETARDAAHRAESALAQSSWSRAWGAAQTSLFISRRGFLPEEEDLPGILPIRRELHDIYLRSLETYTGAALNLGATELATAERAGRELVAAAPYRETGHRLLMQAFTARGNPAEALRTYDELCRTLREELGVPPSPETRDLHAAILREAR